MQWEFESIFKYIKGFGVDVGCGTNRLSKDVLSIDQQSDQRYAHADIVHNCHDLEIDPIKWKEYDYTFKDNSLDFIFSSHCLEDFEDISTVFLNWWNKLKPDGLMLLLLPDMEICECNLCNSEEANAQKSKEKRTARYWTIEDYNNNGKGNPSHKTNVGERFILEMLKTLNVNYEMIQSDTLEHNKTCSMDFVIKKIQKERKHG